MSSMVLHNVSMSRNSGVINIFKSSSLTYRLSVVIVLLTLLNVSSQTVIPKHPKLFPSRVVQLEIQDYKDHKSQLKSTKTSTKTSINYIYDRLKRHVQNHRRPIRHTQQHRQHQRHNMANTLKAQQQWKQKVTQHLRRGQNTQEQYVRQKQNPQNQQLRREYNPQGQYLHNRRQQHVRRGQNPQQNIHAQQRSHHMQHAQGRKQQMSRTQQSLLKRRQQTLPTTTERSYSRKSISKKMEQAISLPTQSSPLPPTMIINKEEHPVSITSTKTVVSKSGVHKSTVTRHIDKNGETVIHKTESRKVTVSNSHPETMNIEELKLPAETPHDRDFGSYLDTLKRAQFVSAPTETRQIKMSTTSPTTRLSPDEAIDPPSNDSVDHDILEAYGGYRGYNVLAKHPDEFGHTIESLDMCLTSEQHDLFYPQVDLRKKRKAIRPTNYLWTNNVIPYRIDPSFSERDIALIHRSMSVWERETCVRFRETTRQDRNFVQIISGMGCTSHVGMIGGMQELTLHPNCRKRQIIVHELGHVIGMIHEHQRPDRSEFVQIHKDNAIDNTGADFKMYSWNVINSYNVDYDYKSIMHYGGTAFARTPTSITIRTLDPKFQDLIGKATTVSDSDISTVNRMYNCPSRMSHFLSSLFPSHFDFIRAPNFMERKPTTPEAPTFPERPVFLERPVFTSTRIRRPTTGRIRRITSSDRRSRNNARRSSNVGTSNWINSIIAPFFRSRASNSPPERPVNRNAQ